MPKITLVSHNNKLELCATVENLNVYSHNNKIYGGQLGQSGEMPVIKYMHIYGHNNRIENVSVKKLIVDGHNNYFIGVKLLEK
jgi:hypothetical protein